MKSMVPVFFKLKGFENVVAEYRKNGNPVIPGGASKYSEAYSIFLAKKQAAM